jgi:hypothetical protein
MGGKDDWWDLSRTEKDIQYAARMAGISELIVKVRMHRLGECEGHPLCPGREVAELLNEMPPWQYGDFTQSLLARVADDAAVIESQRQEIDHLRRQGKEQRDRLTGLGEQVARAQHEADAWLEAYRAERKLRVEAEASAESALLLLRNRR